MAERIDDAPQQFRADRHLDHPAGAFGDVALFDLAVLTEENAADIVLLEVQSHAENAVGELDQFHGHDIFQAIDTGDAIANLENLTHFFHIDLFLKLFDLFFENRGNFFWPNFHGNNLLPQI